LLDNFHQQVLKQMLVNSKEHVNYEKVLKRQKKEIFANLGG